MEEKKEKVEEEKEKEKELEELKKELEEKDKKINEYYTHLQYLAADFDNYKKQVYKEKLKIYENVKIDFIFSLLPFIDNFEKLVNSLDNVKDIKILTEGLSIIYRQLLEFLKNNKVRKIETVGKKFNPLLHEAVTYEEKENISDDEDGKIIEEIQSGYELNGKVIKVAKVKVIKKKVISKEESKEKHETLH